MEQPLSLSAFSDVIASIARETKATRAAVLYSIATCGAVAGRVMCSHAATTVAWSDDASVKKLQWDCKRLQDAAAEDLVNPTGLNATDKKFVQDMCADYEAFKRENRDVPPAQFERVASLHRLPTLRYCARVKGEAELIERGVSAQGPLAPTPAAQDPPAPPPAPVIHPAVPQTPSPAAAAAAAAAIGRAEAQQQCPSVPQVPSAPPAASSVALRRPSDEPQPSTLPKPGLPTLDFKFNPADGVPVEVIAFGGGVKATTQLQRDQQYTVVAANPFTSADTFELEVNIPRRRSSGLVIGVCLNDTPLHYCSRWSPGMKELHGSIGLTIVNDDTVIITMADSLVCSWHCDTRDPTVVTVSLSGGTIRFAIDGESVVGCFHPLNLLGPRVARKCVHQHTLALRWIYETPWVCSLCNATVQVPKLGLTCDTCKYYMCCSCDDREAHSQTLQAPRYSLAVGMSKPGQVVHLRRGQQWHFTRGPQPSRIKGMGRSVESKANTRFTQHTTETFRGSDAVIATLEVVQLGTKPVYFGVLKAIHADACISGIVGDDIPESLACGICDGEVTVRSCGVVLFCGKCDTRNPTKIRLVVENCLVSCFIDGRRCSSSSLRVTAMELHPNTIYHFGASFEEDAQSATLRTDEDILAKRACRDGTTKAAPEETTVFAEAGAPVRYGFVDNMRSINCNNTNMVACCVQTYVATVYTKNVVDLRSDASFTVRVLTTVLSKSIVVGVLDENPVRHEQHCIGTKQLKNSFGVSENGRLLVDGATIGRIEQRLVPNDLVTISFTSGKLALKINQIPVDLPEEVCNLTFAGRFRFGVTLTGTGQSIKIGDEPITSEDRAFLQMNDIDVGAAAAPPAQQQLQQAQSKSVPGATPLPKQPAQEPQSPPQVNEGDAAAGEVMNNVIGIDDQVKKYELEGDLIVIDTKKKLLGQGAFGNVYHATWNGAPVAVKEVPW